MLIFFLCCILSFSLNGSFVLFKSDKSSLSQEEFQIAQEVVFQHSFPTAAHFAGYDPESNEEQVINQNLTALKINVRARWIAPTLYAFLSVIAISNKYIKDPRVKGVLYDARKYIDDEFYTSLRKESFVQQQAILDLHYEVNNFIKTALANNSFENIVKENISSLFIPFRPLTIDKEGKTFQDSNAGLDFRSLPDVVELNSGEIEKIIVDAMKNEQVAKEMSNIFWVYRSGGVEYQKSKEKDMIYDEKSYALSLFQGWFLDNEDRGICPLLRYVKQRFNRGEVSPLVMLQVNKAEITKNDSLWYIPYVTLLESVVSEGEEIHPCTKVIYSQNPQKLQHRSGLFNHPEKPYLISPKVDIRNVFTKAVNLTSTISAPDNNLSIQNNLYQKKFNQPFFQKMSINNSGKNTNTNKPPYKKLFSQFFKKNSIRLFYIKKYIDKYHKMLIGLVALPLFYIPLFYKIRNTYYYFFKNKN